MRDLISIIEALEQGCPPATQDISLNLKNRQKAIDEYHYGPLNPNEPNDEYWQELADKWNTDDIESVKENRCGNCAAFDMSEDMLWSDNQVSENFADGKGPGRAGDSQRHGIPKGATMAELEKAAKASGRKGQLARWQINMRRGKKK